MKVLDMGASMVGRMRDEIFFEKEVADFCGKRFGVSCIHNAIHLLVDAAGIGPGDEVIIQPNTFTGMSQAIEYRGGRCAFVDVEEDTGNLDPDKIEAAITDKTKMIFPLHSMGHPADMDPIIEIAEKHDLQVYENIVHAMGGKYKGRKIPITEAGATSFSLKCLWLPGGGGMVVTDDDELAEAVSLRRYYGFPGLSIGSYSEDNAQVLSLDLQMYGGIMAAIGRIQIKSLQKYVDLQREHAQTYTELLEDTPVITPIEKDYAYHTYLRYVIRAPRRDALIEFLKKEGISCHHLYGPLPIFEQVYSRKLYGDKYQAKDFPVTEKLKKEELALPEPRFRSQWELEYVAKKVKEFYS